MVTTVQRSTDGGSSWEDIDYRDFSIEIPLSDVGVAPTATITSQVRETVTAGDLLRVQVDGSSIYRGITDNGGTKQANGQMIIRTQHDAVDLFEETVSFTASAQSDINVLDSALSAANNGAGYTLTYAGTSQSLAEFYECEDRQVKQVYRDMMDRTDRVWWVDPVEREIFVAPPGNRGEWRSLDAGVDKVRVESFDSGSIETVRNSITVFGTGGTRTVGVAEDQTSIDEYGRQVGDSPYNVEYITTQQEAEDYAESLLSPQPFGEATVIVPDQQGFDLTQPLANYTVGLTDTQKDIVASGLVIEKQTITQGQVTLEIGQGKGQPVSDTNRRRKSDRDVTEPGSVYDSDRIADGAIGDAKLVDASVTEAKLADLAVSVNKLQDNAVVNGKLDDLSVSETKIQDDSIATPKLQAEAVTANEIEADTITAAEIAAGTITALEVAADTLTADEIAAGTITALEIAADTLTANEIDTLDLDTGQITVSDPGSSAAIEFTTGSDPITGTDFLSIIPTGDTTLGYLGTSGNPWAEITTQRAVPDSDNVGSVGTSANAYDEIWAYDYFDADTGSAINDGGDPLAGLAEGQGYPDHCVECDDDGEDRGASITDALRSAWDVNRAQQRRVETLEDTVADLRDRVAALEDGGNA